MHLTPEILYLAHKAFLGGRSAVTGAALKPTLADCPESVQVAHYGLAVVAARCYGQPDPTPPSGVSAEKVKTVLAMVSDDGSIIPNEPPPPPPPSARAAQ